MGSSTLSLCMIVRDESQTLPACLESVRSLVTEIVVADTGSVDNTPEVARRYGARLTSITWEDDFAKARNQALAMATGEWVLVLDADEELDREAKQIVPGLLKNPDVGGYTATFRNYVGVSHTHNYDHISRPNDGRLARAAAAPAYAEHSYCRLFRRRPDIYFVGRVHEVVDVRIRALGLKISDGSFLIHHFGQLASEQRRQTKRAYYRELGRLKIVEEPENPHAWIELGVLEFEHFDNPEYALGCLQRALALAPKDLRAWNFVGMIELRLGRNTEALEAFARAGQMRNGIALREHYKGDALHNLGRLREAHECYRSALRLDADNPDIESKLGYTEVRLGMCKAGFGKLLHAVKNNPCSASLHERLMKAYLVANRLDEAAEAAERLLSVAHDPKSYLRAASIRAQLGQRNSVIEILARGLGRFPDSPELQRASIENNCFPQPASGTPSNDLHAKVEHD